MENRQNSNSKMIKRPTTATESNARGEEPTPGPSHPPRSAHNANTAGPHVPQGSTRPLGTSKAPRLRLTPGHSQAFDLASVAEVNDGAGSVLIPPSQTGGSRTAPVKYKVSEKLSRKLQIAVAKSKQPKPGCSKNPPRPTSPVPSDSNLDYDILSSFTHDSDYQIYLNSIMRSNRRKSSGLKKPTISKPKTAKVQPTPAVPGPSRPRASFSFRKTQKAKVLPPSKPRVPREPTNKQIMDFLRANHANERKMYYLNPANLVGSMLNVGGALPGKEGSDRSVESCYPAQNNSPGLIQSGHTTRDILDILFGRNCPDPGNIFIAPGPFTNRGKCPFKHERYDLVNDCPIRRPTSPTTEQLEAYRKSIQISSWERFFENLTVDELMHVSTFSRADDLKLVRKNLRIKLGFNSKKPIDPPIVPFNFVNLLAGITSRTYNEDNDHARVLLLKIIHDLALRFGSRNLLAFHQDMGLCLALDRRFYYFTINKKHVMTPILMEEHNVIQSIQKWLKGTYEDFLKVWQPRISRPVLEERVLLEEYDSHYVLPSPR